MSSHEEPFGASVPSLRTTRASTLAVARHETATTIDTSRMPLIISSFAVEKQLVDLLPEPKGSSLCQYVEQPLVGIELGVESDRLLHELEKLRTVLL